MSKDKIDITKEIDEVLEGVDEKKTKLKKTDKKKISAKVGSASGKKKESIMEKALEEHPVNLPTLGENITGKVVSIDKHAVYVDLGLIGTGVVYGKEIKDGFGVDRKKLGIGDEITAAVIDHENEDGYVELSISEAVKEQAWRDLEEKRDNKMIIDVRILDANKGGLMVEVNGMTGFMPVSQLTAEHYPRVEDGDKNKILEILKSYIDTEMSVCVIDADELDEKLIVSEKEAHRDKEKTAVAELKVGNVIEGEVSGVVDFGAFIKFLPPSKKDSGGEEDRLEGLVHISQLDWQLIDDPRKIVKVNDKVRAKIISIDDTRISLSIRELKNDPWEKASKKYKAGDCVKGKVHKINHFGAFVYLDKDIHGLAHVSGFPGYPNKAIDEVVKIEGEYDWEIMSIEPNEHRMGLKFVSEKTAKKEAAEKNKGGKTKGEETKDEKMKETKKKVDKETKKKTTTKSKKASKSAQGGSASGGKTAKKTVKKSVKKKTAKKAKKTKKSKSEIGNGKSKKKKETEKKTKKTKKDDKKKGAKAKAVKKKGVLKDTDKDMEKKKKGKSESVKRKSKDKKKTKKK